MGEDGLSGKEEMVIQSIASTNPHGQIIRIIEVCRELPPVFFIVHTGAQLISHNACMIAVNPSRPTKYGIIYRIIGQRLNPQESIGAFTYAEKQIP